MSTILATGGARCSRCGRDAEVRVPYAKLNLCRDHFLEYMENRLYKTFERYGLTKYAKSILAAVSGGKDSMSMLYMLAKLKDKLELRELVGFHLVMGLGGYSEISKKVFEKACSELGVKCIVLDLKDVIGYTLPELAARVKRPPCSTCGVIKRYMVNLVAVEAGIDAAALGHHMDDLLTFALKNFLTTGSIGHLKLAPVAPGVPGIMATRIKPLYEFYEQDLKLYAELHGIEHVASGCPFKYLDPISASVKRMLDELEKASPGFKVSLIRKLTKSTSGEVLEARVVPCKYCGMPSASGVCSFCRLTEKVAGKPLGLEVRSKVRELLGKM